MSTAYDPMLGKVIAHGRDREDARRRLVAALDETAVLGFTTNVGFLRVLAASDEFRDATIDTAWLDRAEVPAPGDDLARTIAAWVPAMLAADHGDQRPVPRRRLPAQRTTRHPRASSSTGSCSSTARAAWSTACRYPVLRCAPRRPARGRRTSGAGRRQCHPALRRGGGGGPAVRLRAARPVRRRRLQPSGEGSLTAPMPGTVLAVDVVEGDAVEEGQRLGVLEAMKMELALKAPFAGTVTTVGAEAGEQVALGALLFEVTDGDRRLPERVTIYEVGPRDGLQNEDGIVPVEDKAEFIRRLLAAGLPVVEATSFVHPKWVPQLADAGDLMERLGEAGRDLPVLVPNERGLDRALELGCRHIAIFGSATETFAQRNLNRSLDEQFAMFEPTVTRAREAGLDVRAYVSMCFGDPWEGDVPIPQVVDVGKRLFDLGASQLSLGDTIGVGTAGHVRDLLTAFNDAGLPNDGLAVHFHDTYGQALANAYAALQHGITTFDASAGGLGGCPYAESATGNLATEDLVWMLHGLGVETGVDLGALVSTSRWMAGVLGRPSPSRVVQALTPGSD